MDKEGVKDLYVSGISAGCVHAFTVAHHFADRILGVGVSTPTTPLALNAQMALPTVVVRNAFEYKHLGDALGWMMSKMSAYDRMTAAPDCKAALDKMGRLASGGSAHWAAVLKGFQDDQDRGMVKGYRGWADNMVVLNQDVPFPVKELAKVTSGGRKFVISTAPDDTTNPPNMQQWWADCVPGPELMHCEVGWGHLHATKEDFSMKLFKRMMGK